MVMITCLDMASLTIVKAAQNGGLKSIVYIVYHNALGTLILFPFFILHIFRNVGRPPLGLRLLFRFFILGLVGLCLLQVLEYVGISYSSPTMASAIGNLIPVHTFLLAVVFRMEKIDVKSSSSRAKLLGTIIAISGAMVFTLYQGPEIFTIARSAKTSNRLFISQPSNWVLGGLLLTIAGICGAIWNVLQTATAREYPDQVTIVFFNCLFGTIQCVALSLFLEPNPSSWILQPGIGMVAVVFGAVYLTAFRSTATTWCLGKKGPVFVTMFSPFSIVIAVILGVIFLGDSLYLGSAIGAVIVAAGFYAVMWGVAKEKDKLPMMVEVAKKSPISDTGFSFSLSSRKKGGAMKSFMEKALPFLAMVMVECGEVGMITLGKAAMNNGLSNLVYVVYYNALGTVLLLPNFVIHSCRNNRRPLTLSVLIKLFGLGLLGICLLQVCAYAGINYSSPTLAAALGNLIPAFTFLFAIIFRMEKFDVRKPTSQAKALGTMVAIAGASVMTFYQGPPLFKTILDNDDLRKNILSSQQSNWILGGFLIIITCICSSSWNVFQTATVKEYPDEVTVVFPFCCFGTIQCAIFTLILERNTDVWILDTSTEWISIVFAAVFGTAVRSTVITWCLCKKGPVYVSMFKPISMVIAVVMGMMFLGDVLRLGSVIGAVIIAVGVYTVLWGQSKERNLTIDDVSMLESPTENTHLLRK
ncbi:hypothetical protein OSB04_000777 [Centaurea solstitialis]|uniref:EamA domain-containing protein n=1 Tax=Centaurea solstitialis TaxID=347529 RepID=A0AA38U2D9_9ASTR|nr:hypothetical protein OSB04_000777 [Centaurea solstitialis]